MYINYSVLMAVYYKDNGTYLKNAIDSILTQSKKTNDFVLVCDGTLTDELNIIIRNYVNKNPELFNIIRLSENRGLGNALREGIYKCKNELIARMDSDDISIFNRCQIQLEYFNKFPETDIVSGTIAEFKYLPHEISSFRHVPENHREIVAFSKFRSPINHACAMYKKKSVLKAGNYSDKCKLEDYFLWVRMIENNCIFHNLNEILLLVRTGNDMYGRRGGYAYCKSIMFLRWFQYKKQQISFFEFMAITIGHCVIALCPKTIRAFIYSSFLRDR